MARFSLSFLVLCFFLALMVSALPTKRDRGDIDAGDAVRTAFDALQGTIEGKPQQHQDTAPEAEAAHTEERVAAPEPAPSPSPTTAEKPAPAASSSAVAPAASAHASDNILSKVPIFGPLLGGGEGLGSIL